ncbi:MAG TPA: BrnA antitoxin family protein [Terriglobales bacterium]|jgi:hypothetical protein
MTAKRGKTQKKKTGLRTTRLRRGKIARLRASAGRGAGGGSSVKDELLRLAEEDAGAESRWSRPRKQRISLRVDCEVVDWLKSKGPGYQTRINRILRRVMTEGKKRMMEK